jgi:hypothetical protein
VISARLDTDTPQAGIMYSLPKQMVLLKVVRERIDRQKLIEEQVKQAKALEEATKLQAEKKKALEDAKAVLAQLPEGSRSDQQKKVEVAEAEKKVADILVNRHTAAVELAAAALRDYQSENTRDTFTFEPQAPVPDGATVYVATPIHSPWRKDIVNLKTSAAGLLEGYIGTAEDKTGEVIQTVVSSLSNALGVFGGQKMARSLVVAADPKPFKYERLIDPLNDADLKNVNNDLRHVGYEIELQGETSTFRVPAKGGPGLYYRRPIQRTLSVYRRSAPTTHRDFVQSVSLLLPNQGPVGRVEFPSSRMVTTSFDMAFKDGMLVTYNSTRPSEVLAGAMLIPNTLSTLVAIPTELIQLKINHSSKDKALADATKAQLESQIALLQAQKAFQTAIGTDPVITTDPE